MAKLSCTVELNGKTYKSAKYTNRHIVILFSALNSCSGLPLAKALGANLAGVELKQYDLIQNAEKDADYILEVMFPGDGITIESLDMESIVALFTALVSGLMPTEPEPDPAAFEYLKTVFTDEETIAANYARKESDDHPDTVFKALRAIKYLTGRSENPNNMVGVLLEAEGLTGIEYSVLLRYYTMFAAQLDNIQNGPRSRESFSPDILAIVPEADRAT